MYASIPRGRSHSDSMDYDDELAELHDKREREFGGSSHSLPNPVSLSLQDSDEDTEDASEDGDVRHPLHSFRENGDPPPPSGGATTERTRQEIKEQIYFDKLNLLKGQLEELEQGVLPEYLNKLDKINTEFKVRIELNQVSHDIELSSIEKDYSNEQKLIGREFEDKKIELRESLINDLEEKRKQIEMERFSTELTSDPAEVKPMNTRKLRRRPNDPAPLPERRKKAPQLQITFLLDDREIEEDWKAIQNLSVVSKGKKSEYARKAASDLNSYTGGHGSEYQGSHSDTRIEDGKLFYEKRWFHRGQPVFVEGAGMSKVSGTVISISQDLVWVRKLSDQTKIRVPISSLQKGRLFIKRRAN